MAHDQAGDGGPVAGQAPTRPGRRRKAPSRVAAIIAVAGIVVWAPAAAATAAGPAAPPGQASHIASTGSSLARNAARQLAVSLPPTVPVGNGPDGLALDPATHTLYSDNQNANSVSVVNTAACNAQDMTGCDQQVHSVRAGVSPQGIAVDTATGTIYVADIGGNTISVINARTCNAVNFSGCGQAPASIKDPGGPIALAVNQATNTIYVANIGDNFSGTTDTVSVINGATCNGVQHSGCAQTPPTVTVGAGPDAVAVDPATDTVYVANNGSTNQGNTVSVINGATCNGIQHSGCGQVPRSIRVGHGPFWIALDQATHTAYTANNTDSTVSVINTATCNARQSSGCGRATPAVPVGTHPWAVTVDQALHTVYVINNLDDTLSAVNSLTCNAEDTSGCGARPPASQVGEGPQAVLTDPATGTVYVANFVDSTVSVVNPAGCSASNTTDCRSEASTAAVGADPAGIAVDQAADSIYVADSGDNTVSVINAATCNAARRTGCARPAATIAVGRQPGGVAIDDSTGTVYVANSAGNTVSVINTRTCNAVQHSGCGHTPPTIAVGHGPSALAVDQVTGTVYVADSAGNTVSVINAATCNAVQHSGCRQTPPTIAVGPQPLGIAVNQITDTVYVTSLGNFTGNTVSVINGATCNAARQTGCGHKPATITVGPAPFGIAIDQATNTIYVANNNGGDGPASLSVINGAICDSADSTGCGQKPPALPGVGRAPNGIGFDQSTGTVYTANFYDATVSVINVAGQVTSNNPPRVAVGRGPEAIAIDPENNTIYVTNSGDGTVSILPEYQ
jgi:YVTN family beta-propeller protein